MSKKMIIVLSFVGGALLFWLVSGILFFARTKVQENIEEKKEVCIEFTQGTIIQMKKITERSNGEYVKRWVPIYEYEIDGVRYERESSNSYKNGAFEEGDKVDIYYNPDNLEELYIPAENPENTVMILTILTALFFIAGFLVLGIMFAIIKNK